MGLFFSKQEAEHHTTLSQEKFSQENELNGIQVEQIRLTDEETISLKDLEFIKVLGRGGYGKAVLINHKSQSKLYAMEILRKDLIQ